MVFTGTEIGPTKVEQYLVSDDPANNGNWKKLIMGSLTLPHLVITVAPHDELLY